MNTNPEIFKAYDIRGVYKKDLDSQTAYSLGCAYAELRQKELNKNDIEIIVAEDMRISSPELKESLIEGLTDQGVNVVDIGLASTPTFYFAVANYNYDGGLIVSASHNPSEWNGFKIVRNRAIPVSGETGMYVLRDKVIENNFSKSERKGSVTKKEKVLQDQIKHDLKYGNLDNIKPLKIVVDTANAMGAQYIEELFKHLPCELIKMNFDLDGNFPAHEADPFKEENVKDLQKKVVELNADLGISTDGDGDRIFFIDDNGKTIEPGIIRAILSKIFLKDKPNSKIAYDIRPGKITPDTIVENGGTPIITKVGHSLIKEIAIKENAYFAGESSGHFFLNMEIGCFEVPNIIILKILEELSVNNQKASEYIKPYQKYFHSGEINFEVKNKEEVLKNLEKKYNDVKINKMDGIYIEYPDWWFNVRCSNTENKVRLNLEANSKKIMEERRDEVIAIIQK